jgi:hypothetical protein
VDEPPPDLAERIRVLRDGSRAADRTLPA